MNKVLFSLCFSLLNSFLAIPAHAAVKAIMEGVPSSNSTILVSTRTGRVVTTQIHVSSAANIRGTLTVDGSSATIVKSALGNPSNDSNPVAAGEFQLQDAGESLTFGTYATGNKWIQAQNTGTSSTSRTLTINPNGAAVIIRGVADGSVAGAGFVGEVSSDVLHNTQTPTASNSWVAIGTVALSAGDWDVSATCDLATGGTTNETNILCCISTANNSCDSTAANNAFNNGSTVLASNNSRMALGPRQVNISSSANYFLVGNLIYSVLGGATWTTNSTIRARRMR